MQERSGQVLMIQTNARSQLHLLLKDLAGAFQGWEFWVYLGWNDIAKQYRRSFIGPIWITLNTALFIVAFGLVGAQLFKIAVRDYLSYFCIGHILFGFFSALLNEGCLTYINATAFLKQTAYPKTAFVLRVLWKNLILLGHNFLVILGVLVWAGKIGNVAWVDFAAALLVALISGALAVAILGALAARFRDIPMMVQSIMQIAFFLTPVIWKADQLTERAKFLVVWNPLAAYLDILRRPLLGESAPPESWYMALGAMAAQAGLFIALYLAARRRIVYWL
ncbi:MAG: ABC transporter permease [Desulfobacteraceae bacterium]|nr:MAG: ABC transporter permease [Desulfobacteraceae bacterium]